MVEYKIILAVGGCSDVYIRTRMIYMHNVIYYVSLIPSSILLLCLIVVVICIVCFHIDVSSLLLWIIELLVTFSYRVIIHWILRWLMLASAWMDTEFVTVNYKTFNLIRQHRQPFVLRPSCIDKLNVIWSCRWDCIVNWSMWYLLLWFTWNSWNYNRVCLNLSRRDATDSLGLIHWMGNSFIVYQVTIVCKPMSMTWAQHFKLLIANIDPGIFEDFFRS